MLRIIHVYVGVDERGEVQTTISFSKHMPEDEVHIIIRRIEEEYQNIIVERVSYYLGGRMPEGPEFADFYAFRSDTDDIALTTRIAKAQALTETVANAIEAMGGLVVSLSHQTSFAPSGDTYTLLCRTE